MRRSSARIDSKYSSRRNLSAELTTLFNDRASASTASITERLLFTLDCVLNIRSKIVRGSISLAMGLSGADQEIAFRGNELEK